MLGLEFVKNGERRFFLPDGNVTTADDEAAPRGTWRSQDEAKDNHLRYTWDGEEQEPIPVQYSFNEENQLVAVVPAAANGDPEPKPFAFFGMIHVDDAQDVDYALVSPIDAQPTGQTVTVYGALEVDMQGLDKTLVVHLADGGTAKITGVELLADRNPDPGEDDRLEISASTSMTLENGHFEIKSAEIKLNGHFNFKGGSIEFVAEISGESVSLSSTARLKAVTAGFELYSDDEKTELALKIQGEHTWKAGQAKWNLSLGYTDGVEYSADVSIQHTIRAGDGELAFDGQFAISGDSENFSLDVSLEATYKWDEERGELRFLAKVSDDPDDALNYELLLEGTYKLRNGQISFDVTYTGGEPTLNLSLDLASREDANFDYQFGLVVKGTEEDFSVEMNFDIRFVWINGQRVKKAIAA